MGTPVRRSSRGRISWSRMKRTTLVTSQVTTTTARAERIALTVIVTSPALTLALATRLAMRSRSSSAECASVNDRDADRPAEQQDDPMQRAQYRVSPLAHAAQAPQERRSEEPGKDLVEHPCQRGEDQPVPRAR